MLKKSKKALCILLILLSILLTACGSINTDSDTDETEASYTADEAAAQERSESKESNITPDTGKPGKDPESTAVDNDKTPEASGTPETDSAPETSNPAETENSHTHSYGAWSVTKKATCNAKGTETRICSCGIKETRNIPATGHNYEWVVTKEATANTEGTKVHKCKVCGNIDKTETVPKIVSKIYHTSWGTRPYEFEEVGSDYFASYLKTYVHWDRYGNFWWDWEQSSNGHGKQVYSSSMAPKSGSVLYFEGGRWANMGHYWTEGGSTEGTGGWDFGVYAYPGNWGEGEIIKNSAPSDSELIYFLGRCGNFITRGITQDYQIDKEIQVELGLSDEVCNALINIDKDTIEANMPKGKLAP